jgi:glycosyltransferase involved in cell wall biosynthesis
MKILHVVPSFFPAITFGGPVVSVFELCNQLAKNAGVGLRVLTTDTAGYRSGERLSLPERDPHTYKGYAVHFSAKVFGTAVAPQIWKEIWPAVSWADVIHLTGMYSFPTLPTLLAARMLRKPLVWSPRGALKEWIGTKNKFMKATWRKVCRAILVPEKTILHVTSSEEESETRLRMPGVSCVRIPNGVEIPKSAEAREWMPNGELRLLSLGRIDPIKGIENLLLALPIVANKSFCLTLFGTGDSDYVDSLHRLAERLNIDDRVRFAGQLKEAAKGEAFRQADVTLVPSHTENFGIVVSESLAHGVPVIAGRGTPWSGLETHRCGFWVDNSPTSLARAIDAVRSVDLESMGKTGRAWMQSDFRWDEIARQMRELYARLM